MPSKKIIIILSVFVILLTAVMLVYIFFFKTDVPPEEEPPPGAQPQSQERIHLLSAALVLQPTIDGQKVKYPLANSGLIMESNFDGSEPAEVAVPNLSNAFRAVWSNDSKQVILFSYEQDIVKRQLLNLDSSQLLPLGENILDVSFSPASDKIAYQFYNPGSLANNISQAKPDGTDWQNIATLNIKNLNIDWPTLDLISLQTRTSGLAQGALFTLSPNSKNLSPLISDTYGLSVLFSPQGEKFLYSSTDDQGQNLQLKVADKNGQLLHELTDPTLVEKCVWSQDDRTLYCAIPQELALNLTLPDDFYKGLPLGSDLFWRINIETNQKSPIIEASKMSQDFDAHQLLLSNQEDYLFFVNKIDGLLYSLEL